MSTASSPAPPEASDSSAQSAAAGPGASSPTQSTTGNPSTMPVRCDGLGARGAIDLANDLCSPDDARRVTAQNLWSDLYGDDDGRDDYDDEEKIMDLNHAYDEAFARWKELRPGSPASLEALTDVMKALRLNPEQLCELARRRNEEEAS